MLIGHIQSLLRDDAYDESCLEILIDTNMEDYMESDSEDFRPVRSRVRTARCVDEVPTPPRPRLIAKKRKRTLPF